jgi:hypothetical protein
LLAAGAARTRAGWASKLALTKRQQRSDKPASVGRVRAGDDSAAVRANPRSHHENYQTDKEHDTMLHAQHSTTRYAGAAGRAGVRRPRSRGEVAGRGGRAFAGAAVDVRGSFTRTTGRGHTRTVKSTNVPALASTTRARNTVGRARAAGGIAEGWFSDDLGGFVTTRRACIRSNTKAPERHDSVAAQQCGHHTHSMVHGCDHGRRVVQEGKLGDAGGAPTHGHKG